MDEFKNILSYQYPAALAAAAAAYLDPLRGTLPGDYSAPLTGGAVAAAFQKFSPQGGKMPENNQMAIRNLVGGVLGGFAGMMILTGNLEPSSAVAVGTGAGVLFSPYFYRIQPL